MRLVQFSNGGRTGVGVLRGDDVLDTGYGDMLSFIRDGDAALEAARRRLEDDSARVRRQRQAPRAHHQPREDLGLGPELPEPRRRGPGLGAGRRADVGLHQAVAARSPGPYDDIVIPPDDDVIKRLPGGPARFSEFGFAVDWEVELGVVIGKTAKNVRRADAAGHVFGYTVINDVGARSVQFHFGQRDLGKNFDTFCPMGPCIVTADEIERSCGHGARVVRQRRAQAAGARRRPAQPAATSRSSGSAPSRGSIPATC